MKLKPTKGQSATVCNRKDTRGVPLLPCPNSNIPHPDTARVTPWRI